MQAEHGADDDEQHALKRRHKIVTRPIERQKLFDAHPQPRVIHVLLFKFIPLVPFPAERAHDAHARQIFLRVCREDALLLVAFFERFPRLRIKYERIADEDGNKRGGDQGEPHIHDEHQRQRKHHHDDEAEQRHQLIGDKVGNDVRVRRAALNDVACLMRNVPAERQPLYVREKFIAHAAHERLIGAGIEIGNAVLKDCHDDGDADDHKGDHPDSAFQVFRPAEQIGEKGEYAARRLVADHAVNGKADDLRDDDVEEGDDQPRKDTDEKQRAAAPQKYPSMPAPVNFCPVFAFFIDSCRLKDVRKMQPADTADCNAPMTDIFTFCRY